MGVFQRKDDLGQYLTNAPLSKMMASFMTYEGNEIRILDPGAGAGSLSAACVDVACNQKDPPNSITLTAYEIDHNMAERMRYTLKNLNVLCRDKGIIFNPTIVNADFYQTLC